MRLVKSKPLCVVCKKWVGYAERQIFQDPRTKGFLHWHCSEFIRRGLVKWNSKRKCYEKIKKGGEEK